MRFIIGGIISIILGSTGQFVLIGTNSPVLLIVAGIISVIVGIVELATAKKKSGESAAAGETAQGATGAVTQNQTIANKSNNAVRYTLYAGLIILGIRLVMSFVYPGRSSAILDWVYSFLNIIISSFIVTVAIIFGPVSGIILSFFDHICNIMEASIKYRYFIPDFIISMLFGPTVLFIILYGAAVGAFWKYLDIAKNGLNVKSVIIFNVVHIAANFLLQTLPVYLINHIPLSSLSIFGLIRSYAIGIVISTLLLYLLVYKIMVFRKKTAVSNNNANAGTSTDAFEKAGFKVMDFRSDTEKQAEKEAGQPLEEPLEKYANDIVDVFANYDGNSTVSDDAAKSKIRPIGEKINDNKLQLQVFHRAVFIGNTRNIRINTTTMERFWNGCGGWQS